MAIAENYGSAVGVVALVPRYGSGKGDAEVFTTVTRPTLLQVETWLVMVSSAIITCLATEGFEAPVEDDSEEVKELLDMFANTAVSSLVEGVNGVGRFGPNKKAGKRGGIGFALTIIAEEACAFISDNASGFVLLGLPRPRSLMDQVGFVNDTFPIRQREEFGNLFTNWQTRGPRDSDGRR